MHQYPLLWSIQCGRRGLRQVGSSKDRGILHNALGEVLIFSYPVGKRDSKEARIQI